MTEFRYKAFLSYSHRDTATASWLHKALERYTFPRAVRDRVGFCRVYPIFRDREELPTSSDLSATIRGALQKSESLIVLCSPAAAQSRWVNEEVEAFRQHRGLAHVHCVIVDGPAEAARALFPPAVLDSPDDPEPLAADLRAHADGRNNAKLKLIAGLIGANFDELRRREMQRRYRKLIGVSLGSAAGMIVTTALAFFALISRDQAVQARQLAETEAAVSKEVTDFLIDMFEVSDPYTAQASSDITAREVLERGAARIESDLGKRPEIKARLTTTIGYVLGSVGTFDRSQELIEQAISTLEAHAPDDSGVVADSYFALGRVHGQKGEFGASAAALQHALEGYLASSGENSVEVARTLELLATAAGEQSRINEAKDALRRASEIRRRLPGADKTELAASVNQLGEVLTTTGDFRGAIEAFEEAIAILRDGPATGLYALTLANLAAAYQFVGESEKAVAPHREALALKREIFGATHFEVAYSLNNLAVLHWVNGQYTESEPLILEALDIFRKEYGREHGNTAVVMAGVGLLYESLEQYEQAERWYRDALPIVKNAFGANSVRYMSSLNDLASVRRLRGDAKAAAALHREAILIGEQLDEEQLELGVGYAGLAMIPETVPSIAEREQLIVDGLGILERTAGPSTWTTL